MARDIFSELGLCHYCNRPGVARWDVDLASCSHEVCEALAFAELKRRSANRDDLPLPVRIGGQNHRFDLRARPHHFLARAVLRAPTSPRPRMG
jgi:hypothetical protein